jgi:hypothetical protein
MTDGISTISCLPDTIASAAIGLHTSLPKKFKPVIRSSGVPEWTILAAIYLSIPSSSPSHATTILPISLGTGVKVLPSTKLPPLGDTVHDCHAEILARRGLKKWMMEEVVRLVRGVCSTCTSGIADIAHEQVWRRFHAAYRSVPTAFHGPAESFIDRIHPAFHSGRSSSRTERVRQLRRGSYKARPCRLYPDHIHVMLRQAGLVVCIGYARGTAC